MRRIILSVFVSISWSRLVDIPRFRGIRTMKMAILAVVYQVTQRTTEKKIKIKSNSNRNRLNFNVHYGRCAGGKA